MATNKNFEVKNGLTIAGTERISSAGVITGSLAGSIASATTATTQSATDNSTKIATTAYTDAAITAVIGGAPGTLDTLNELAAAINDDASYASTLTTALATKAPLASPTFTGILTLPGSTTGTRTIKDSYSSGALANQGFLRSSGGNYWGYSTYQDGSSNWKSAVSTASERTVYAIDEDQAYWSHAPSQTVSIGGDLTTQPTKKVVFDLENGKVGIGVTSPGARLELDNPSSFTNMIQYGNVTWNQNSGHGLVAVNRGSDGYVQLQLTSGVDNSDVFTIRNSGTGANVQHNLLSNGNVYHAGNVGIGTATPGSNHAKANNLVVGSGSAGGMAIFNGTGEGWYAFSRANANNTDSYDGGISYDGSRNLKFHTNAGAARWVISGTGHFTPNNQHSYDIGGTNAEVRNIKAQSIDMGTGTSSARLPNGTTAQRPTGALGQIRYNTTTSEYEVYKAGLWLNVKTNAGLRFQQGSTYFNSWTISADGQTASAGGTYSGITTNLNLEGDFVIITKWQHDYMSAGICYKAGITNADFTGESADSNGPYGGADNVNGFVSGVSGMYQYHFPNSTVGGANYPQLQIRHKRVGNTISTAYSTNSASGTDPSHSSWVGVDSQSIASTDHCKPIWGEASGTQVIPLEILYVDITGAFNST
jgi:hypothetical protein